MSGINRAVVLIGRTADSKSDGWGFESLLPCMALNVISRVPRVEREIEFIRQPNGVI